MATYRSVDKKPHDNTLEKPARLGIVSRMQPYDEMTSTFLTEAMGNVVRNSEKAASKYQKLNSLMFEWEIELRQIKYVYFAADVTEDGSNQSEITMYFTERYYEVDDTFMIDSNKQMCIVIDGPIRKDEKCWEYTVRLMTGNADALLDTAACYRGARTRWIGELYIADHDYFTIIIRKNTLIAGISL